MKGRIIEELLLMICVVAFVVSLPRKPRPEVVTKTPNLTFKAVSPIKRLKGKGFTEKEQKEEVSYFLDSPERTK